VHTRTFRSKKLNQDHIKILNEAIRHNAKGKQKDIVISYKKENGEVSERKVRPFAVKDKSLFIAHCHERNAIRSFRVERISMVKQAFWDGFEKMAIGPRTLERGALAAFKRSGNEIPAHVNYHGLEGLLPKYKNLEKVRDASKFKLQAYKELFPKGQKLSKEEALRRANLAAAGGPYDSLMPHEKERKKLKDAIFSKNPELAKRIEDR
jgi:hypothetical protein